MHYIKWTCGCEWLPSNSCCKWVEWEHWEERTRKNGGMNLPNIRVRLSVSRAARHVEISLWRRLRACCRCGFAEIYPCLTNEKLPHSLPQCAWERWETENPLRLSASLLSVSFSSTSRHNQAVQPGLMNESKRFRWLQSGDAPTTHVRSLTVKTNKKGSNSNQARVDVCIS